MDSREQEDNSPGQSFQGYLEQKFGTSSKVYQEIVPHIFSHVIESNSGSRISQHFAFWQESVDINIEKIRADIESSLSSPVINDGGKNRAEEFLYSLQSYYSLILNADRMVNVERLSSAGGIQQLNYGELSSKYTNVLNQPEDKPFEPWLDRLDDAQEPFDQVIRTVIDAPERACGEDGFKDLYQNIIGNPFRKAMGEFYTREWLAELILREIGYDGSSILDPACGSGAFLVKAAKKVMDEQGIEGISKVTGFDLNPVAVAAAKSNLLGSAAAYSDEGEVSSVDLKQVTLPVYWTNSIIWSEPDLHGNNITLLSPLTELQFPEDPEQAIEKVSDDVQSWSDPQSFSSILDQSWSDEIAESFTAPVRCSPFEYVVGNPPWVSPDRMSKDYRDRVKELLEDSGFLEPFQPDYLTNRFPNKQFVATLPFYEVSMRHYMSQHGKCSYLVTSSLLKSMNGGGFREQMQEWNLTQVLDFTPYTDIHQSANSWGCVPVITRSDDENPSVEYEYFTPTDGAMPPHEGDCRELTTPDKQFHVCSWEILREELPFIPEDKKSPWVTAPPSIVKIYRQMLNDKPYVGENYRFTRGLVTGRNDVYVINEIDGDQTGVNIQTGESDGRVSVESDLIYPFVEGKNLSAWDFGYTYLLLPYNVPNWTPIDETKLSSDYPNAYSYFESNRDALESRRTHTISSQIDKGSPYYVVESRDILGERAVVGIREISPYLEAAVVPSSMEDDVLGGCETVIAHTLNFVVPDSDQEAYYLAGIFNSWAIRTFLYDLAQPKGGRPGKRFDMYLISSIPAPEFNPSNQTHQKISELAEEAHSEGTEGEQLEEVESELNRLVAEELYSITESDLESLRQHYERLSHTPD